MRDIGAQRGRERKNAQKVRDKKAASDPTRMRRAVWLDSVKRWRALRKAENKS